MKDPQKKQSRITPKTIAYATLGLVVVLAFLFILTAPTILNRKLSQIKIDFQDETYQIQNKQLKFQPLKLGFSITGFEIVEVNQPSNHLFDCSLLSIQNINLYALIFKSEISAKRININESNTKFDINKLIDGKKEKTEEFKHLNFNRISINEVVLSNARIAYSSFENIKSAFTVPKVDLVLKGFEIKNTSNQTTSISISDFLLRANNLSVNIIEDSHRLNMDEIEVSLLNNEIFASNVRVVPKEKEDRKKMLYWANVPKISIKTNDLNNFIKPDSIDIELCQLDYPEFNIETPQNQSRTINLKNFNLSKLLKNELKQVSINRFVIWNGNATISDKKTQKIKQAISQINLKVFDLVLNDQSWNTPNRIFGADGILLDLGNYTFDNKDGIHRLSINELKFDTRIKNLSTNSISYSPIVSNNLNSTTDFNSMGIYMRDINFHEALQNLKLQASVVNIKTPDITLNIIKNRNANKTKSFSESVNQVFSSIEIGEVILNEGYFKLVSKGEKESDFKTRFDINLKKINSNKEAKSTQKRLFFAEKFEIQLEGTSISMPDNLHQLASEKISFSSDNDIATIKNFRVIANDNSLADTVKFRQLKQFANVTIPIIKLNNTNLYRLFNNQELIATSLLFSEPRFSIDQYGSKKKSLSSLNLEQNLGRYFINYLDKIDIERITLSEGKIYYTNFMPNNQESNWSNTFSLKLNEFHFPIDQPSNEEDILFSENIDLTLNKFNFDFPDGSHNLAIERLNLNTQAKQLKLNEIQFFPDYNNTDFGDLPYKLIFSSPSILVNEFHLKEFLAEEKFNVGNVNIETPNIQLIFPEKKTTKKTASTVEKTSTIEVNIENLNINNAALGLSRMDSDEEKMFSSIDFSTQLNDLSYKVSDKSFNFNHLIFDSDYFNYQLNDNYNLSLGQVYYNQGRRNFTAQDLYIGALKELRENTDKSHFDVSAKEINLSAFDILRVLKEQKLIGNILEIKEPRISQTPGLKAEKSDFDPYNLKLHKQIKDQLEAISFNKVLLSDAGYTINKEEPKYFRNIDITGVGFNVDTFSDDKELPFNFRALNLKLANYSGKTSNDYYSYSIRGIELDSKGTINLRQMALMPNYSRKEFFERKQYQDDYFNVSLRLAQLRGIDFRNFFKTNEFIAKSVDFDFEKVSIFRDKRLELPPDRRTKIPSQIIRELDQKITIEETTFQCDHLVYEEMEPQAREESHIFFTNLKGISKNVSNIPSTVSKKPQSSLNIAGDVFGVGKMNVDFTFELQSKINEFAFSATCGKMPLMLVNTISEPGLKLSIKDGINQRLEVNFIANEDSAIGNMRFYYNDLKVAILEQKKGQLREQGLVSFVANTLVNSDNPRQPGKPVEMGYFINQRDKQRSIIQYCWRSIFEGMKSSIGMKQKK